MSQRTESLTRYVPKMTVLSFPVGSIGDPQACSWKVAQCQSVRRTYPLKKLMTLIL